MVGREDLMEKIRQKGDPNDPNAVPILVTLEDFFEGNDDPGSIGCNLTPMLGPQAFYSILFVTDLMCRTC